MGRCGGRRLARDLKTFFPGTAGFSAASLWRMRQFHEIYTAPEFLAQLVRENERDAKRPRASKALAVTGDRQLAQAVRDMVEAVPWGHHVNLLSKLDDPGQRLFYLKATARFGWSRNVLLNQIKAQAYERSLAEGQGAQLRTGAARAPRRAGRGSPQEQLQPGVPRHPARDQGARAGRPPDRQASDPLALPERRKTSWLVTSRNKSKENASCHKGGKHFLWPLRRMLQNTPLSLMFYVSSK